MSNTQKRYEKGLKLVFENQFKKAKSVFEKIERDDPFVSFYIGLCDINYNHGKNADKYILAKKKAVSNFKKNMKKYENAYSLNPTTERKYILGYLYTKNYMGKYYDFAKGFQLLKRAAKDGYAPAQCEYAKLIQDKLLTNDNLNEADRKVWMKTAFLNIEKAVEQGYGRACYFLAECYSYGHLDTKINPELAMKYYKEGAKHNVLVCHTDIASRILYDAKLKDKTEGFNYLLKASRQHYARADRFLAIYYYNGFGCQRNDKEAIRVAKRSVKAGHVQTNLVLYNIYKDMGNKRLAAKYGRAYFLDLKKLSKNSHMKRFYLEHVGSCYLEEIGTRKNKPKAIEYYKKASNKPICYTFCMHKLAAIFLEKGSCYYNFFSGTYYLEKALAMNDIEAAYKLGQVWEEKRDIKKAQHYYKIAADKNYPEACYALGKIYARNSRYDRLAIDMFQNAYNGGIDEAFLFLQSLNNKHLSKERDYGNFVKIEDLAGIIDKSKDEMLTSQAMESINTAVYIYEQLIIYSRKNNTMVDFSPVITLLSKAVEIEFKKYFKKGYIEYLLERNVKPIEMAKFNGIVIQNDKSTEYDVDDVLSFTMGNIVYTMDISQNPEKVRIEKIDTKYSIPYKGDETNRIIFKTKYLVDYLNSIFKRDAFSSQNRNQELLEYLYSINKDLRFLKDYLRNSAVHSSTMNVYDANIAIDLIVLSKRMLFSFKEKLIDIVK